MGVEAEDPTVVGPDPFEDAVAVQQSVVEYGDPRCFLGMPLAFDPDRGHNLLKKGAVAGEPGEATGKPAGHVAGAGKVIWVGAIGYRLSAIGYSVTAWLR
jgi:hypothetical protein